MLEMEENLGSPRALESQNIVDNTNHNDIYVSEYNKVFDDISPQATITTSRGNGGSIAGYPAEWTSSLGDEREGGGSGSIAERRAATCGFNAGDINCPTINISRFRSISPLCSPVTRSPFITIPAGISPRELLDSPVMLHHSQAQPSSTTGTFQLSPLNPESVALDLITTATDREIESDVGSSIRSQILENLASSIESKGLVLPIEFSKGIVKNSDTETSAKFEDSSKTKIGHVASQPFLEGDQTGTLSAPRLSKTSEDGYNWRKYGQKQVKASEFPRSYYKCTHPNCLVKKIVERSHDGEVVEIIYRGAHKHPLPQPRPNIVASFSDYGKVNDEPSGEAVGGIVWRNIQPKGDSGNIPSENLDITKYDVAGSYEPMSRLVCQDDDGTSLEIKSLEDDVYLDESEAKRRKTELPFPETHVVSRGVREPRVVVQIESEVDILDDGYRWRKYGQKVVKGNPNPRSYYKCTSAGCQVRKQVERACDDYKFVITTYEGKHDHEVPVSKNASVSITNLSPTSLPRINTNSLRAEPLILGNDFMRSALLGNLGHDLYPLHFPNLQNSMAYGYGGMSNFPMSLLYGVPRSPIMMPGGVDVYNLAAPAQSSVGGQHPIDNELGLKEPKQEKI